MSKIEGICHCGKVEWTFESPLESATACNCTVCRRYGALWAYGFKGEDVHIKGSTKYYVRGKAIEFHFCPDCGCITHYLAIKPEENGRLKAVVNLRMAKEPEKISHLLIDHFDGFDKFDDLPRDGRCIKDMWF